MPMEEFTNSGLLALLGRVIADHDPGLSDGGAIADPMKGAVADAAGKRSLVRRVMDRHGPGPLLAAGQQLQVADETPALTVLVRSTTPRVLAEKFMRLERYHHSSHRTAIETGPGDWRCTRTSEASPATDGENCLIAGLLLGLVLAIGREACRLEIAGQTLAPDDLLGCRLPPGGETARFRISWQPCAQDAERVPDPKPEADSGRFSDRLAALFATDPGRSWRSADAARMLAVSERSMQRRLGAEARSYSSVLRRARMKDATILLVDTDASLADIGYCCGYADQSHFQRDFLRTANVTPREFRRINRSAEGAG